eukprot:4080132-Pyramimonas_sp.AAC.1
MTIWKALSADWTTHDGPSNFAGDSNIEPMELLDSVPWRTLQATLKSTHSYTYSRGVSHPTSTIPLSAQSSTA